MFGSKPESEDEADVPMNEVDSEPLFVWNEHMRIVLAIVIMVVSACFMWWIVA